MNHTKTIKKKTPKLKLKLDLKKENQSVFQTHQQKVLKRNGLKLKQPNEKRELMAALSEALFQSSLHAKQMQKQAIRYIKSFEGGSGKSWKGNLPENLRFLKNEGCLVQDFCEDPKARIFESLNLEIISLLFEVKINLYSVFGSNNLLFSSIFNNNYQNSISIFAVVENQDIYYGALEMTKPEDSPIKSEENQPDVTKFIQNGSSKENGQIISQGDNFSIVDNKSEIYRKYDHLFGANLNTLQHIEYKYQKMKENAMSVNQAQKQLSAVFHQYAKSVNKASTKKNQFFFTEQVTFEDLDPIQKQEIIFGEKTLNYIDIPPPGLDPPNLNKPVFKPPKKNSIHQISTSSNAHQNIQRKQIQTVGEKPVILDESRDRKRGYIKFFLKEKNHGFIVNSQTKNDIFVHGSDLMSGGLTEAILHDSEQVKKLELSYCEQSYLNKRKRKQKKAIDIRIENQARNGYFQSKITLTLHQQQMKLQQP